MEPKDPKLAVETVPKALDIRCCKAFMLVALLMMNVVLVQLVLWSNQPGFPRRASSGVRIQIVLHVVDESQPLKL